MVVVVMVFKEVPAAQIYKVQHRQMCPKYVSSPSTYGMQPKVKVGSTTK